MELQLVHTFGDQCAPPWPGADSPKATDWVCTKHFAPAATLVLGKMCDHPSGSYRIACLAAFGDHREGALVFSTKVSGVYCGSVCLALVTVSKEGFLVNSAEGFT